MKLTATVLLSVFVGIRCLYEDKYKTAYSSLFEQRCYSLKTDENIMRLAFVGDRCFVVPFEKVQEPHQNWQELHDKCNHVNGYKGRLAHIYNKKQIDGLYSQGILRNDENTRFLIGARRRPSLSLDVPDYNPDHGDHWYYYNANGDELDPVNPELWLTNEPDNTGVLPPENVVALEKLTSLRYGFNDVNSNEGQFHILCEYGKFILYFSVFMLFFSEDFLECPPGWTLIDFYCYKVFTGRKLGTEAKTSCESESTPVFKNVLLAPIPDDEINLFITKIAQEAMPAQILPEGIFSYNPVMFGLKFDGNEWKYDHPLLDSTPYYYRWYSRVGHGEPINFVGRTNYVALLNTYEYGGENLELKTGYWTIDLVTRKYPYVCRGDPIINE
ncbi:unnamed protein product [Auanema sp. JU1783]|nr:unnamed protein product [Auanema sp. JU1783]